MAFTEVIKQKAAKIGEREKRNHYIVNIMMVALFSLVILLTMFGGVNVNVGSTHKGDGEDAIVHQSFFQIAAAALSFSMNEEKAEAYVKTVKETLEDKYSVLAPSYDKLNDDLADDSPYNSLNFTELIKDAKSKMGKDVSKINWVKYRFALSILIANPGSGNHKASWDGHIAVMSAGQTIFLTLIRLALIIISFIMLGFAVMALIKKQKFTKGKFSLILLLICFFASLFFKFDFLKPDAAFIMVLVLIPLAAALYAGLQHIMMEKHDFSLTMFIYNGVLLLGAVISFILMVSPLFKVTDPYGVTANYAWSFLFDLSLGEGTYMAVPMSYFLQSLIASVLLMLHVILNIILVILLLSRFIEANYQHNDKKALLIGTLAVNVIIYLILGILSGSGGLTITSLSLVAKVSIAVFIMQPLILGGLIAFVYLFKPKPVKKELVIK